MAEYLKNNPMALRHCLLYEFLQEKSVEKAFDDFCETVGLGVIKKKEFQFWFNQFEQGKFDKRKKSVADMREVLRNDKQALRACVMYEWLTTKNMDLVKKMKSLCHENEAFSPFTEYKNFCKVIGDDAMGYREFEFWFYRFENGMFDLEFERDKEKKMYKLVDMPIDIMKNVVKYLNIVDRVSLARTSRSFKTFVEDQKSFQKKLDFFINDRTATISCEPRFIVYENRGYHWKQALKDLKNILEYPKLHLETISCQLDMPIRIETSKEFESLDKAFYALDTLKSIQQLPVKKVSLRAYTLEKLLIFIRFLRPGYLTTIDIFVDKPDDEATEKLFQMEQWKQAKYFYMSGLHNKNEFYAGSLFHFYHFKEFHVLLRELSVEDIRQMKEILFKSPEFEKCTIRISFENPLDVDAIRQEFGDAVQENPHIHHYPIPDTTEYFEIEFGFDGIGIVRKKE